MITLVHEMLCAILYYLCNLKNMKNKHGGVLLLVKFQALSWNFTKSNTAPWVFFVFFKLYKCCKIAQRIMYKQSKATFLQFVIFVCFV